VNLTLKFKKIHLEYDQFVGIAKMSIISLGILSAEEERTVLANSLDTVKLARPQKKRPDLCQAF